MECLPPCFGPRFRSTYVITAASYENKQLRGSLYSPQLDRSIPFDNLLQLLLVIEELMDRSNMPQRGMDLRMFQPQDYTQALLERPAPAAHQPALASFSVTVLFRQNASWQGTVVWNERQLESHFRSALELISLMDGALSQALAQSARD